MVVLRGLLERRAGGGRRRTVGAAARAVATRGRNAVGAGSRRARIVRGMIRVAMALRQRETSTPPREQHAAPLPAHDVRRVAVITGSDPRTIQR